MPHNADTVECKIKTYRLAQGWSQEELARLVQVGRQAIYDMESGRYVPNTAVALRLARVFSCTVEDLFVENPTELPVHIVGRRNEHDNRLAVGRVRDRLVGIPLRGFHAIPFSLRSADGLLDESGTRVRLLTSLEQVEQTLILLGCDPALEILRDHLARGGHAKPHYFFAPSRSALGKLGDGIAHVAGTHFHDFQDKGGEAANVSAARHALPPDLRYRVYGFSYIEEGLMVAAGNPLNIRSVEDLAQPSLRFLNRGPGAALRTLLDKRLAEAGVPAEAIHGYNNLVRSHYEGAWHVLCGTRDAALGFRVVAESFGLSFVPLTQSRSDLVIPADMEELPAVRMLLDTLHSGALRKEIGSLPGYDAAAAGVLVAEL
jgi:molybdate-binding protein/DNA-binding XRE family transcriptional regulator